MKRQDIYDAIDERINTYIKNNLIKVIDDYFQGTEISAKVHQLQKENTRILAQVKDNDVVLQAIWNNPLFNQYRSRKR